MKPASLAGDVLPVQPCCDHLLTHATYSDAEAKSVSTDSQELPTCSHVDEDTLVGSEVSKVKQDHVGSDVVDKKSSGFLEAHPLRY